MSLILFNIWRVLKSETLKTATQQIRSLSPRPTMNKSCDLDSSFYLFRKQKVE